MPTLTITKSYDDGTVLTESQLDDIKNSIETFINTTGLGADNIQAGAIGTSELDTGAVTTVKIADEAVTRSKIDDVERIPAGSMTMFGGPIANLPAGWLECDGTAVSRTTYATLFAAIGTAWGTGDGSSTFNLPDMRGMFPRGYNHGKSSGARDADAGSRTASGTGGATGDNVGSYQANQNKSHNHGGGSHTHDFTTARSASVAVASGGAYTPLQFLDATATTATPNSTVIASDGGTQAQPENVSVMFIIKY